MFDLTGKTALVTGATGTIGGAIARRLHGQGATVAISGTRVEVLEQLAKELGLKDVKGVVVGTVKPGSPAAEAGLSEGMVIETVNKKPVTSPEKFKEALQHTSLKNGLIFQVRTSRGTTLLGIRKG